MGEPLFGQFLTVKICGELILNKVMAENGDYFLFLHIMKIIILFICQRMYT
jgi:hypothetical protein